MSSPAFALAAPLRTSAPTTASRPARCVRRPQAVAADSPGTSNGSEDASPPPPSPGADWRAFRARLVRGETGQVPPPPPSAFSDKTKSPWTAPEPASWAHAVPFAEAGGLLLSSPAHFADGQRRLSFFAGTAVLLLEHGGAAGSLGLVLNRPVAGDVGAARRRAARDAGSLTKAGDAGAGRDALAEIAALASGPVRLGGPVGLDALFVLHADAALGRAVCDGVRTGPTGECVQRLRERRLDERASFFCGYAGWHAGQLDEEVAGGAWVPCAASADLVLRQWPAGREGVADVLRLMGGEYADMAREMGGEC